MDNHKPKIFFVATVEFAVNAFLLSHLQRLSCFYDLTVITNTSDPIFLIKKGVNVKVIPLKISRHISLASDLFCLLYLIYLFLKNRPMAVHSITPKSGLLAMLAAFLTRIPLRVHSFTGQIWVNDSGIRRYFLKTVDFLIGKLTTINMIDSPSQKDFLVKQNVLYEKKSIVFGSGSVSGVNIKRFLPNVDIFNEVRFELSIPRDAFVFIYLGRLNKSKGILDLAEAFSRINNNLAYMLIVGPDEGSFREQVKSLNQAHLFRLRFIDLTLEPERYLAASNALCLPSYREGFGNVVIEAAATGLPAIASNIYGISDAILNQETGLLHKVGDIEDIVCCLERFLNNPQEVARYSYAARSRVLDKFNSDMLTEYWLNFYRCHLSI
ncbi:glycosyltransferase [Polynucleobacter sp. AM-26B4]|uniref:glycosyltransferase n=1 Tax=Polynucleobacter sp. AM-26B4 TaxID=2689103 RepID=UPI001C0C7AE0|nr:glycosyltransferase [Polynucleobacter sp. AM-26B4]MBU3585125.1 glycosyltransferase [Polynucleobacter sp. AM-26B4]